MTRGIRLLAPLAALGLLAACTAPGTTAPEVESAPQFASRQLTAVGLTAEDFGEGWALIPGEEGSGGGPGHAEQVLEDPCTWVTQWVPDQGDFATHSWRMYANADGVSYGSDWLAAAAPGADLHATLDTFAETIRACGPAEREYDWGTAVITLEPDVGPQLGDASFSYRATFAEANGAQYGEGEVHLVVCGPLWLHLSYSGWDPFVERDRLLGLLVERASALGGCTP